MALFWPLAAWPNMNRIMATTFVAPLAVLLQCGVHRATAPTRKIPDGQADAPFRQRTPTAPEFSAYYRQKVKNSGATGVGPNGCACIFCFLSAVRPGKSRRRLIRA